MGYFLYIPIVGLCLLITAISVMSRKKKQKRGEEYLRKNPNAAKVRLQQGSGSAIGYFAVHSVNGSSKDLVGYTEGCKHILILLPGTHIIEASYQYRKKKALSKTVQNVTIGPVKLEVSVEPTKSYVLAYNLQTETFSFEEEKVDC